MASGLCLVNMGDQDINIKMMNLKAIPQKGLACYWQFHYTTFRYLKSRANTKLIIFPTKQNKNVPYYSASNMWNMKIVSNSSSASFSHKVLSTQPLKIPTGSFPSFLSLWKSLTILQNYCNSPPKFPAFRIFLHQCNIHLNMLLLCWKEIPKCPNFSHKTLPQLAPPLPLPSSIMSHSTLRESPACQDASCSWVFAHVVCTGMECLSSFNSFWISSHHNIQLRII